MRYSMKEDPERLSDGLLIKVYHAMEAHKSIQGITSNVCSEYPVERMDHKAWWQVMNNGGRIPFYNDCRPLSLHDFMW